MNETSESAIGTTYFGILERNREDITKGMRIHIL